MLIPMSRRSPATPWACDPVKVATHECDAWVGYYRRDWRFVLTAAVGMVRHGFGMSWPRTLHGARLVLRANQAWAPYPDKDPDAARTFMARFYALGHPLAQAADRRRGGGPTRGRLVA